MAKPVTTYHITTGAVAGVSPATHKKVADLFSPTRFGAGGTLERTDPKFFHLEKEGRLERHLVFDPALDFLTFLNRDDLKKFQDILKRTAAGNIENLFDILNCEKRSDAALAVSREIAGFKDVDESSKEKFREAIFRMAQLVELVNEKTAQNFDAMRPAEARPALITAVGLPASRKSSYVGAQIKASGKDFVLCSLDETRYEFDLYRLYKTEDLKHDDNWTLMEISKLIRAKTFARAKAEGFNINLDASNLPFDAKKFTKLAEEMDLTLLITLVSKPTVIAGNEGRFHHPHQHFVPLKVIEERCGVVKENQLAALRFCYEKGQSFFMVRETEPGKTAAGEVVDFRKLKPASAAEIFEKITAEIENFYARDFERPAASLAPIGGSPTTSASILCR